MASKKKESKSSVKNIILGAIILILIIAGLFGLYKAGLINFTGPGKTVAKVNGEKITQEQLDSQYEIFFLLIGYPDSYKEQITKELYLNQMIAEELMLQEAEKIGISPGGVSSAELKSSIDIYLRNNGMTAKELAESIVSKELTTEDLQDYFTKQIAINKFLNETMLGSMQVTDDEAEAFYQQNADSFKAQEGQIRARHILVETEEEAKEIVNMLKSKADFAELAMERSLDTGSGARGGELGFFSKEMMVGEFADAAFKLSVNQISAPVKTEFGWHVIQRESDKISFNEIKDMLKLQLNQEKQKIALQTYLEQLKANAEIEILMNATE